MSTSLNIPTNKNLSLVSHGGLINTSKNETAFAALTDVKKIKSINLF